MKYIFFGTPRFAAIILDKLIKAGFPPVAVVANPDRPYGRKKVITPPETKKVVLDAGLGNKIEILQPEKLDAAFLEKLKSFGADFFVVAAYAKILKNDLIRIPPKGVIGIHPSLLPEYRGSSPIQSALLDNTKISGTALFIIDEKVDHGLVISSKEVNIEGKNYLQAEAYLAEASANLFVETIPSFIAGKIVPQEQNHENATFTRKFSSEDGLINLADLVRAQSGADSDLASKIDAKVRALNPEPGTYTIKAGKRIKILETKVSSKSLLITAIQIEGKTPRIGVFDIDKI